MDKIRLQLPAADNDCPAWVGCAVFSRGNINAILPISLFAQRRRQFCTLCELGRVHTNVIMQYAMFVCFTLLSLSLTIYINKCWYLVFE